MAQPLTTDDRVEGKNLPALGRDTQNNDVSTYFDLSDGQLKQTPNSNTYQIQHWTAKTYRKDPQIVIHNNIQYKLNTTDSPGQVTVPFVSTDIDAEIAAFNWKPFESPNKFPSVILDPTAEITVTEEGEVYWNGEFHTIEYDTGLGATVTIGNTDYWVFYNDTGVTIPTGRNLHLLSGTLISGQLYPTFELADPRTYEKVQGTLAFSMHSVADGALGLAAKTAQQVKGVDTSGVAAGAQLWIKPNGTGEITDIKPQFPDIAISIGGSYDSDVNGSVLYNVTSDINELFDSSWDGSCLESFNFTVSSDGATVTGLLENVNILRDLPIKFSTGLFTLDTTTSPLTVVLTPGTDVNPQNNFVYIPASTKVLTVSTSAFPLTEHSKIAQLSVQSAVTTQGDGGALRNQNINDHIKTTGDNGHILHIAERIRQFNAEHESGTEGSLDSTGGNGYVSVTGGKVWQLHLQDFPSLDMATGDDIRVVNDFTTPYNLISNLNAITAYSTGSTWSNDWSKVVVWGVANKTGEPSNLMVNIPSDGYNSEANALADALNYADYSIPSDFKGVGFLIAAFTIRISGGSITYNSGVGYQDLRGFIPNNIAGGGGGGGGVTSFLALNDTPSSYAGQAGKAVVVNQAGTALEFGDAGTGGNTINPTPVPILDASTTDLPINYEVITYPVASGSTTLTFTSSVTFDGKEKTSVHIIDNTGNPNQVSITFSNTGLNWTWKSGDPLDGIPANGKLEIELKARTASELLAETDTIT